MIEEMGKCIVICEQCESKQTGRWEYRDVRLSDDSGWIRNILVGVCGRCDDVCLIPHVSVPSIKKQREEIMFNAEEATKLSNKSKETMVDREVNQAIDYIMARVKEVAKNTDDDKRFINDVFQGSRVTCEESRQNVIDSLIDLGFTYQPAKDGDSREHLDYGSPDRLIWK